MSRGNWVVLINRINGVSETFGPFGGNFAFKADSMAADFNRDPVLFATVVEAIDHHPDCLLEDTHTGGCVVGSGN